MQLDDGIEWPGIHKSKVLLSRFISNAIKVILKESGQEGEDNDERGKRYERKFVFSG
jgi:hypothetical protein